MKSGSRKAWTDEETKILLKHWDDRDNLEIWTKLLNRTCGAIIRRAIDLDLKKYYVKNRKTKSVPQESADEFLKVYKELRNVRSIDRKDNSMGYTKDNVVLCTWMVNHAKNTLSHDQYIELCHMVVENLKIKVNK